MPTLAPLLTIPVTQDHIDCGVQRKTKRCALALAITDALPTLTFIHVTTDTIAITFAGANQRTTFTPDEAVIQFIDNFDGNPTWVQPGTLTLNHTTHQATFARGQPPL